MYRCLLCDKEFDPLSFQSHAKEHGWHWKDIRQSGFEYDKHTRLATHEFSESGGPALFWMTRQVNPLPVEDDF